MTVRELIDVLRRYPDDMRVAVNGYEAGYDDLSPGQIAIVRIALTWIIHDGLRVATASVREGPRAVSGRCVVDPRTAFGDMAGK